MTHFSFFFQKNILFSNFKRRDSWILEDNIVTMEL